MKLPLFIVDAFAEKKFGGNPAGVVPLENWLPEDVMQSIANENNQAETAFFVKESDAYSIRWFTPVTEVDLCGHATLASAHVLFEHSGYQGDTIVFNSKSGPLTVTKKTPHIILDFPLDYFLETEMPDKLQASVRSKPNEVYIGKTDYLLVYEFEEMIRRMTPDFGLMKEVRSRGVIVTCKGTDVDFIYRFFAPQSGIDEDPATGSAQTTLMNYWSKKLNANTLKSVQISERRGYFESTVENNRVKISGKALTYLQGEIEI